jgi:hypothetical protein
MPPCGVRIRRDRESGAIVPNIYWHSVPLSRHTTPLNALLRQLAQAILIGSLLALLCACRGTTAQPPATGSVDRGEPPPIKRAIEGPPGQPVSNGQVEVTVSPVIQSFDRIGAEKVAAGLVFDVIEVTVRNLSDKPLPVGPGLLTQGIQDFRCYPDHPPPPDLQNPFPTISLQPGQSVRGSLVFDNERQSASRFLAYDDGEAKPILIRLRQATRRFQEVYPGT